MQDCIVLLPWHNVFLQLFSLSKKSKNLQYILIFYGIIKKYSSVTEHFQSM